MLQLIITLAGIQTSLDQVAHCLQLYETCEIFYGAAFKKIGGVNPASGSLQTLTPFCK